MIIRQEAEIILEVREKKVMEVQIFVLCGIVVFLLVMNCIERYQFSKRESDLYDRLMAKSHDEYAMNKVRMASVLRKPEYIGELNSDDTEEEEEGIPVN